MLILEHLAEKSGEDDDIKDEFQFGILVDEYVPVDWWDKTEVFDLPFKVIFDTRDHSFKLIKTPYPIRDKRFLDLKDRICHIWTIATFCFMYNN